MAAETAIVWGVWLFELWLLMMRTAGEIAEAKGRSFANWAALAFLYGPLALIAAIGIPPLRSEQQQRPPAG